MLGRNGSSDGTARATNWPAANGPVGGLARLVSLGPSISPHWRRGRVNATTKYSSAFGRLDRIPAGRQFGIAFAGGERVAQRNNEDILDADYRLHAAVRT